MKIKLLVRSLVIALIFSLTYATGSLYNILPDLESIFNPDQRPQHFQELEDHHFQVVLPESRKVFCSGVIIAPYLCLVNKHCLDGIGKIARDGFSVLKKSFEEDLALIQVDPNITLTSGKPIWMKLAQELSVGEVVFRINPKGQKRWERGKITRISEGFIFVEGFEIRKGSSGTGAYNTSGELVGMTCAGYPKGTLEPEPDKDITMLVHYKKISKFLEEHK